MPPTIRPLQEMASEDHGLFQTHLMRSFAQILPWHSRPQLSETPYALDDFLDLYRKKLVSTLHPPSDFGLVTRDVSLQRTILKHLSYTAVAQSVHRQVFNDTDKEYIDELKQEALFASAQGKIEMPFPHHPLYNNYKAYSPDTQLNLRLMDISRADRDFAKWFATQPLEQLLNATPEFAQPSPNVRISNFACTMRKNLCELLQDKSFLDNETAHLAVELIVDEWLSAKEANTDYQKRLEAMLAERGLTNFQGEADELVKRVPSPTSIKSVKDEANIGPLYEHIAILSACDGYNSLVHELVQDWTQAITHLKIPLCDRPTTGLAQLATMINTPLYDLKKVRYYI